MSALSEGRFTTPTVVCPHPERWTSVDGDSTEVEVSDLAWGLARALRPMYAVETGSGWGQTSERIAAAMADTDGVFVTLDVDPVRVEYTTSRLDAYPNARAVVADSFTWEPPPGTVIDFAWFDSFYELRVPEFVRLSAWMRAGTIVCFHDSAPEHGAHRIPSGRDLRGEIAAVLGGRLRVVHLPTPRGITIGEVL